MSEPLRCGGVFQPLGMVSPCHCSRLQGHAGVCGWGEPSKSDSGGGVPPYDPQPSPVALYLKRELVAYLDGLTITSENIGDIRRSLFMPWDSAWNGIVREETASREGRLRPNTIGAMHNDDRRNLPAHVRPLAPPERGAPAFAVCRCGHWETLHDAQTHRCTICPNCPMYTFYEFLYRLRTAKGQTDYPPPAGRLPALPPEPEDRDVLAERFARDPISKEATIERLQATDFAEALTAGAEREAALHQRLDAANHGRVLAEDNQIRAYQLQDKAEAALVALRADLSNVQQIAREETGRKEYAHENYLAERHRADAFERALTSLQVQTQAIAQEMREAVEAGRDYHGKISVTQWADALDAAGKH